MIMLIAWPAAAGDQRDERDPLVQGGPLRAADGAARGQELLRVLPRPVVYSHARQ